MAHGASDIWEIVLWTYGYMGSVLDTVDWDGVWCWYMDIPWIHIMEFLV